MKLVPNDVDVIILPGPDYPCEPPTVTEKASLWPFIQVIVAADNDDLERWVRDDFGTDRNLYPKGVVELLL